MPQCTRCNGEGAEQYEEDPGRLVRDFCYHCNGIGEISEDQIFEDRVRSFANQLACKRVYAMQDSANSDPEGEGWAFRAAENMMSEYDYTQGYIMTYEDQFYRALIVLPTELLIVLLPEKQPPVLTVQDEQIIQQYNDTQNKEALADTQWGPDDKIPF